jgi:hypothetical protein
MRNARVGLVLFAAGVLVIGIGVFLKLDLGKTFIVVGIGFTLISFGSLMMLFSSLPAAVLQVINKEGLDPGWILVILAFVAGFGGLMLARTQDAPAWVTLSILAVALLCIGRGSYVATRGSSDFG